MVGEMATKSMPAFASKAWVKRIEDQLSKTGLKLKRFDCFDEKLKRCPPKLGIVLERIDGKKTSRLLFVSAKL